MKNKNSPFPLIFASALVILLPPLFCFYIPAISLKELAIFYFCAAFYLIYSLQLFSKNKFKLELKREDLEEQLNLVSNNNGLLRKNNLSLEAKISRYQGLKKIIEKVNENLNLDYIAESLTEIPLALIADNKGESLLYLVDDKTQRLSMFKSRKKDNTLVLKAKEGDIFDHWVMRHASPLLIEDAAKDFRFDLEKLKVLDLRPVLSLISCPFVVENRFLGIIRLDSPSANFYTQDDLRLLASISDIGAVALENGEFFQRTKELAIHDALTSLYTKGYFIDRLKEECNRHNRKGLALSLLMLDIDYFKNYNDKFGHSAGDIVLKKIGLTISQQLKDESALICRFGGEEFCVILPSRDKQQAFSFAEAIRKAIENTKITLRRQEASVTVSIGVSSLPEDTKDDNELIRLADKAMYEAKQQGRNKVVLC